MKTDNKTIKPVTAGNAAEGGIKGVIAECNKEMLTLTYVGKGQFALIRKPVPHIINPKDAIVRVTLGSICTSDLHIKHGSVPRAVPGIKCIVSSNLNKNII